MLRDSRSLLGQQRQCSQTVHVLIETRDVAQDPSRTEAMTRFWERIGLSEGSRPSRSESPLESPVVL